MARRHAAELDALQAGGVFVPYSFLFFPRLHPDFNHFDLIPVAELFLKAEQESLAKHRAKLDIEIAHVRDARPLDCNRRQVNR